MLARAGARPLILESQRETGDALCGGFISWRTLQTLESLGLSVDALAGHRIDTVRLFSGARRATAPLPSAAISISRQRLDTLLLDQACAHGAALERGVVVRSISDNGGLMLRDGTTLSSESVFVATGKHDVRGLGRARTGSPTLGLRVRLPASAALHKLIGSAVELHLFPGGYAGLALQEDGSANLCLAVRKDELSAAEGSPRDLLTLLGRENAALGERLAFAASNAPIDAIAAIPYGWICAETQKGLFRLGDQAACIPSLAGEGNGLALASGVRAARAWIEGGAEAALAYQRDFAAAAGRPVGVAKRLWQSAESPRLAPWMVRSVALFPPLARLAASLTRIGH